MIYFLDKTSYNDFISRNQNVKVKAFLLVKIDNIYKLYFKENK